MDYKEFTDIKCRKRNTKLKERNMKSNLKWVIKRGLLKKPEDMPGALPFVLIGFVDKLKAEKRLKRWYTSLKGDKGGPSFRIYLEVDETEEPLIENELDIFLRTNAEQIGWNGNYFNPEEKFDSSFPYLADIHLACELVLKVVKQYPDIKQRQLVVFWDLVRKELYSYLLSIDNSEENLGIWHFFHFVANNLCFKNDVFLRCLLSNTLQPA